MLSKILVRLMPLRVKLCKTKLRIFSRFFKTKKKKSVKYAMDKYLGFVMLKILPILVELFHLRSLFLCPYFKLFYLILLHKVEPKVKTIVYFEFIFTITMMKETLGSTLTPHVIFHLHLGTYYHCCSSQFLHLGTYYHLCLQNG